MITTIGIQVYRFLVLVLIQILILNNLEVSYLHFYAMVYPLFIMLLPVQMRPVLLLFLAFIIGFVIDIYSDTFGLHASASLIFAYFRLSILKWFTARDEFENENTPDIASMGFRNFVLAYGTLLLIHHTWYFTIEIFKFNEILLLLQKVLVSLVASLGFSLLIQLIFLSSTRQER